MSIKDGRGVEKVFFLEMENHECDDGKEMRKLPIVLAPKCSWLVAA